MRKLRKPGGSSLVVSRECVCGLFLKSERAGTRSLAAPPLPLTLVILRTMANDANKKLLKQNQALLSKYRLIILGVNALYALFRMYYLWDTFSSYHIGGFALTTTVYFALYFFLSYSAAPKYKPSGDLVSAGTDLSQAGLIEYTWDILYVTIFVQLGTGFLSDWLWLVYTIPPCIGFYYLWTMVIYPWISKPDEPEGLAQPEPKKKVKYGKAR